MDYGSRVKLGLLTYVGVCIVLGVGVVAFALAEAIGSRHYGWLLIIPVAAWCLRRLIVGMGKILRANPNEAMGLGSGDGTP